MDEDTIGYIICWIVGIVIVLWGWQWMNENVAMEMPWGHLEDHRHEMITLTPEQQQRMDKHLIIRHHLEDIIEERTPLEKRVIALNPEDQALFDKYSIKEIIK